MLPGGMLLALLQATMHAWHPTQIVESYKIPKAMGSRGFSRAATLGTGPDMAIKLPAVNCFRKSLRLTFMVKSSELLVFIAV